MYWRTRVLQHSWEVTRWQIQRFDRARGSGKFDSSPMQWDPGQSPAGIRCQKEAEGKCKKLPNFNVHQSVDNLAL